MADKEVSVSDLLPSPFTTVQGVFVGALSPVKTSRKGTGVKYFEGKLSDGSETVRLVSFEPKLRPQVKKARRTSSAVFFLKPCS